MNDDDLFAALRRADPARDIRDDRSELQIQAALSAITATPARRARGWLSRRWPLVALPAVAAAVVAVVVGVQLWQPAAPAVAVTPPLLTVTPITATTEEVLDAAISRLQAAPDSGPERASSSEGWYLQTEIGEDSSSSVIQPQNIELEWREDLSGEYTRIIGEAYTVVDGVSQAPHDPDAPPAGTVVAHDIFGPGEAPVLLTEPPPSDPVELREYLSTALGMPPSNAGEVMSATRVLLSEWRPGPAVQAALLTLLLEDAGDLEVVGDVTDRLGRAATALRASDPAYPYSEMLLLISRDTGAVIGLETIYLGGLDELDLVPPSVTEYVAWK